MKKIPLSGKLGKGEFALVDDEDFDWLNHWKWYLNGKYIWRHSPMQKGETTIIYIHRLIMNAPHGIDVDHIDMDKLNNQRGNLRLCTRSQNMMNSGKRANNVSGYKGVSLVGGKYIRAQIRVNGEKIHLGNFPDSISAAKAHDEVARKYHGEFARTNF